MVSVGEAAGLVRRRQGSQVRPAGRAYAPLRVCGAVSGARRAPPAPAEYARLRSRNARCGARDAVSPPRRIWGQDGGRWVCESILEDAHDRTVRAAAWSPGDDKLATASFDGTCVVWSCRDGEYEQVATLQGHENEVCRSLRFRTRAGCPCDLPRA